MFEHVRRGQGYKTLFYSLLLSRSSQERKEEEEGKRRKERRRKKERKKEEDLLLVISLLFHSSTSSSNRLTLCIALLSERTNVPKNLAAFFGHPAAFPLHIAFCLRRPSDRPIERGKERRNETF